MARRSTHRFRAGRGDQLDTFVSYGGIPVRPTAITAAPDTRQVSQLFARAQAYIDVQPVDPLDALFRFHDIAYDATISGNNPLVQAQADLALIEGIAVFRTGS
jgi:hypothetical protein